MHRPTYRHPCESLHKFRTQNENNWKHQKKWLVAKFVNLVGRSHTKYENIANYGPRYHYNRNASPNTHTLWNVDVWEMTEKIIFWCFENNKHFTCMILAFYHLFSRTRPLRNCDIPFRLFLVTSVEMIHPSVKTLCLTLGTECEVCFSNLRKCSWNTGLQQAHKNDESQRKWRWKPQHDTLVDLSEPALVQQRWRICCSTISMVPY